MTTKRRYKTVLTIAGSDPSGGAGIQADIKTISALGCYAASALTAVVDENTVGVYGIHDIPVPFVCGQIRSVVSDIGADAVKVGMLHSAELIEAVADTLLGLRASNIVLDPVMVATQGGELMQADALAAMRDVLLPMARIATPNIPEAERLLGASIASRADMVEAARSLSGGRVSVLLKSGHLQGDDMTDVLFDAPTRTVHYFAGRRVDTVNTHGTGCTLSSAIAAHLALGADGPTAVARAKRYIEAAIAAGAEFEIGHGHGPVCHFFAPSRPQ